MGSDDNRKHTEDTGAEGMGKESELEEPEARFLSLHARYGSEIISVMSPDGELLYESASIERMLGYRHAEEVAAAGDWFRYVHSEDVERLGTAVAECMAIPGEHPPVDFRIKDAEGNWRWLESRGINLSDDPRVGGVVVSTYEITERKKAEQELTEGERRFRQLFEQSVDAVIVHDEAGNVVDANQQASRSLGYSREELLAMKVGDYETRLFSEEERSERERSGVTLWQRIVASEPGTVIGTSQGENRRKDGTTFPVEVLVGGVGYEGRTMILSSIRDVTERTRAEQALVQSEEHFRGAFEEAPVGVALVEMSGQFLRVNHALCAMFGYTDQKLLSMNSYDVTLPIDHADSQEWMARQQSAEARGETGETIELRFARKDGTLMWALVSASLVKDVTREPSHWVCHYQDITERKALEERLEHQALHDPLTGLPGRELATDRLTNALSRARRKKGSVAVLFVDVDNLKPVNDSLGHEAGDRLLYATGERLRYCVRDEDTVARFSGDEFVVVLEGPNARELEERTSMVAGRILERLQEPLHTSGYEVPITASIGIAIGPRPGVYEVDGVDSGADGETGSAEDLIRHADTAMYRAKSSGGNGYAVFQPEMDREALEHLELSSDLHRAIERGELQTYYQHKVDLATGGVAGWEALLRWEHPERGPISPETFIPLAEDSGLIGPIGKWVLEQACEQARIWRERHPKEPGQFMSVNLSARQFADPDLEGGIERILERIGLPARALDLEITERVLLEDEVPDFARIRHLKELGVSFSLDDFGTGYSSLLSLKQLPVDFIKIDRSFIERVPGDTKDEAFVSAMVSLARALGIKVVAEGIEREEQWGRLREMGCDYGQGHYFSRPLPSGEASNSMRRLEDTST